jgi:hypothetical protein
MENKISKNSDQDVFLIINQFINLNQSNQMLHKLESFLNEKNYFKESNLAAQQIKYSIKSLLGKQNEMILETDKIKNLNTFVQHKNKTCFYNTMLILADAYIELKLLNLAQSLINEVIKQAPEIKESYLKLFSIKQEIGETFHKDDPCFLEIEKLKSSTNLFIEKHHVDTVIYLLEKKELNMALAENLIHSLADKKIIRVFIDNRILYEDYVTSLTEPLSVALPNQKLYSSCQVSIRFL